MTKEFGSHFLIELIDCPSDKLEKVEDVEPVIIDAVEKGKSKMVGSVFHQFQPVGVSGVVLISWSHFSIHTWPEESYAAADIFTCGEEMDPYIAIEAMKEGFGAKEVKYKVIKRGY